MELYPKRKTDEEYIEALRKLVARSKWFGVFHAFFVLFFLGMFLVWWHLLCKLDQLFPELAESIGKGIHIGIMFGAVAGLFAFYALQAVFWSVQSFCGQRTERLLLKFHDRLKEQEQGLPKPSNSTSEPAPGAGSSAVQG